MAIDICWSISNIKSPCLYILQFIKNYNHVKNFNSHYARILLNFESSVGYTGFGRTGKGFAVGNVAGTNGWTIGTVGGTNGKFETVWVGKTIGAVGTKLLSNPGGKKFRQLYILLIFLKSVALKSFTWPIVGVRPFWRVSMVFWLFLLKAFES